MVQKTRLRGYEMRFQDDMWHVYAPDGKHVGAFEEKADASLFVMRRASQDQNDNYQERMRKSNAANRAEDQVPMAYGALLMTGNPFIWHFASIIVVFLFVIGVGIPIFSNIFNGLFRTGRAASTIELAQLFSGVSLLYLIILTLGAILLVILRSAGMQGGFARTMLVGALFNIGLFGLLLIGILGGAAVVMGILGLFGFEVVRSLIFYGLVMVAIYILTNYFYRELLS